MEQIITGIIYIIIGLVGIGLGYLVKGTNSGLTALSSNALLYKWAVWCIKYAQEFISNVGTEKMVWVVGQLSQLCKKSNVKVTDEQLKILAEGVYNEVKEEVKNIEFKEK